jgi:hypothetical protein
LTKCRTGRPTGGPVFDRFLTNRISTKFREPGRSEQPYKTRHFITSTKCRELDLFEIGRFFGVFGKTVEFSRVQDLVFD